MFVSYLLFHILVFLLVNLTGFMRGYLKYLSFILPLAILLTLPCSAKNQVKQIIYAQDVPTNINTYQGEKLKICNTNLPQKDRIQSKTQRLAVALPLIKTADLIVLPFYTVKETFEIQQTHRSQLTRGLYLLYRKLILFF